MSVTDKQRYDINGRSVTYGDALQSDSVTRSVLARRRSSSARKESLLEVDNNEYSTTALLEHVEGVFENETCQAAKSAGIQMSSLGREHLINIFLLGLGFLFAFGAFFTCMNTQTVILNSINDEYFVGTPTMGYVCLALSFTAMTVSFALSPALSVAMGPKASMVIGAVFLSVSVCLLLRPLEVTLYIASVCQGVGAGIMWTVNGHFLVYFSTNKTIGRNTGIFWMLFQAGPLLGNLFYFSITHGSLYITESTRHALYGVLIPTSVAGVLTLASLRHYWFRGPLKHELPTPVAALKEEWRIAKTKEMLLLAPMFVYMGIELTFFMNVYGTSLGYTRRFGAIRESLVGLNGVFVGIGQVAGGLFYSAVGPFLRRNGRDLGVMLALLVHIGAFYICFLTLPFDSPLQMTNDMPYMAPNAYAALSCSFLMGFGDAGWNNPLFALIGVMYPNDPVSAFAIFQAWQSFGNVIAFAYSTVLSIPYQLGIMIAVGIISAAGYCIVEWKISVEEMISAQKTKTIIGTELQHVPHKKPQTTVL